MIAGPSEILIVADEGSNAAAVAADPALCGLKGSPTQVVQTFLPQRTRTVREITGTTAQQCAALKRIIEGGEAYGTGN